MNWRWGRSVSGQGSGEVSWCLCFLFEMIMSSVIVLLCSTADVYYVYVHRSRCCSFWIFLDGLPQVHKIWWTLGFILRFINALLQICLRFLFKLSSSWCEEIFLGLFLANAGLHHLSETDSRHLRMLTPEVQVILRVLRISSRKKQNKPWLTKSFHGGFVCLFLIALLLFPLSQLLLLFLISFLGEFQLYYLCSFRLALFHCH